MIHQVEKMQYSLVLALWQIFQKIINIFQNKSIKKVEQKYFIKEYAELFLNLQYFNQIKNIFSMVMGFWVELMKKDLEHK